MPAFRRLSAGGMTSSWDFPSVIRIPILGNPSREPDSGLKQFSKIKFKASPGDRERGESNVCKGNGGREVETKKNKMIKERKWWENKNRSYTLIVEGK